MTNTERDMMLIDGRRVQVSDLIEHELLLPGASLVFRRPQKNEEYRAVVTDSGRIRIADGREFAAPSRAAMEAADLYSMDGWLAWLDETSGKTLGELRNEMLSGVAEATQSSTSDSSQSPEARHRKLSGAAKQWTDGDPVLMTVRDLIDLWGAQSRGNRILDKIDADLENYSLLTKPDFRKVSLDTVVELQVQSIEEVKMTESDGDARNKEPEQSGGDELDVGLTLGNVASAMNGVQSVNPEDKIEAAITTMRLNDFSQLPVMLSERSLKGVVTWRSITEVLAKGGDILVKDACIPTREFTYDQDLVDVLPQINKQGFVFVTGPTREIAGLVTTSDVVELYRETATPFFIIGEIDHLLRHFVSDRWTIEQISEVCDPNQTKKIGSHDDLSFGDYQRMLENPERFDELNWPFVDRKVFISRLDEIRETRNSVTHFDPDPLDVEQVANLRNFLKLLRELGAE